MQLIVNWLFGLNDWAIMIVPFFTALVSIYEGITIFTNKSKENKEKVISTKKVVLAISLAVSILSTILAFYAKTLIKVPEVESELYTDAKRILNECNLKYSVFKDKDQNIVKEQSPKSGTVVKRGTKIKIVLDKSDTGIKLDVQETGKSEAGENSSLLGLEYLSRFREGENKYPLFNDDISQSDNTNELLENCATQILLTNDNESSVLLEKIIFEAEDIKVNTSPILEMNLSADYEGRTTLYVTNKGWGEANDITVTFKCINENIDNFF